MNAKALLAGLKWTSAATLINFTAQFFFLGVMARLLDPGAFGLMAMSSIVLRFASFFAQMGAGQALIQKRDIDSRDVGAAVILAFAISSFLYALIWLTAPLAGAYFRNDALIPLVRWVGLNLILASLSGVALAYIRREGRFAALSAIEVLSYIIGYGAVGIVCAFQGLGVWSLAIASISQAGMACLLGFAVARPPLQLAGAFGAMAHFWDYGSRHSLNGFSSSSGPISKPYISAATWGSMISASTIAGRSSPTCRSNNPSARLARSCSRCWPSYSTTAHGWVTFF